MPAPTPHVCPHCERTIGNHLAYHMARCPQNDALYARYAAALADPEYLGHALTTKRYDTTHPVELLGYQGNRQGIEIDQRVIGFLFIQVQFLGRQAKVNREFMYRAVIGT